MARRRPDDGDAADRDLLTRIARGDRRAFEAFYRAHARSVLAFVRDVVHLPELAEEVAADVMVAVWTSAARYRGNARAMTWVLGIAHHKSIDALRRGGRAAVALDAALGLAGSNDVPEEIVMRAFERAELERALNTLTPEHRAVLQLMYAFSRTLAEIADIAGCPVATVKTRLFYAKRRLRDALDRAATGDLS